MSNTANPFTSSQLYRKISTPALNILDYLASITRETSWDLSAVIGSQLGTIAAARFSGKPFIVGFIPPDVTVNFVPIQAAQSTLVTIPVTTTPTTGSGSQLTGGQVPMQKTPLTRAQALGALLAAGCPQSALLIVAAQSAMETGQWQLMNNNNFGNVTPTSKQVANGSSYFVQSFGTVNGVPQSGKFLAFSDPTSGAAAMVNLLRGNGSLNAASGGVANYVQTLQANGYMGFVGKVDQSGHVVSQQQYDKYQAGIQSLVNSLAQVTPVAPPSTTTPPQEFGGATTPPTTTPPNAQPAANVSVMTNSINVTDANAEDPLSDQLGRNIYVADGQRVQAVQAQTNYLNQQILAIQAMPALMMLVNPTEFNRSYEHTTDPVKTRSGYVVNMWLEKPLVISAKGVTAGQYVFQSDGGGGISSQNRIYSVSYQNLMSLVAMFKNNANIFTDGTFGDGNTGIPLISMSLYIYYDNHIYIGSFDDFTITDDGNKPYNLSYDWKFTVRYDIDTTGISDSYITGTGLTIGTSAARSGF
jgi:hypothetical protein